MGTARANANSGERGVRPRRNRNLHVVPRERTAIGEELAGAGLKIAMLYGFIFSDGSVIRLRF